MGCVFWVVGPIVGGHKAQMLAGINVTGGKSARIYAFELRHLIVYLFLPDRSGTVCGNDAGVFSGGWRAERLHPVHVNVFAVRSALVGSMLLMSTGSCSLPVVLTCIHKLRCTQFLQQ
jgi:hypothetical protein